MENENGRYFSRSWAMLTRDKGWVKPLLVMTVASLVPIAGGLGIKGYALEWARLTAWGADAAPKQKNVDVGKCIGSGWRGFVVDLGLALCLGLASGVIAGFVAVIPGFFGDFLSGIVSTILLIASLFFSVALMVAEVRAAIYERIGAGYRVDRVWQMISRDYNGFVRVFLVGLAWYGILLLAGIVFSLLLMPMLIPLIIQMANGHFSGYAALNALSAVMIPLIMACVVFGFAITFVSVMAHLVMLNAVGLWMRQFDVPSWGRSEDPLPGQPVRGGGRPTEPDQTWQQPQRPWQEQAGESDGRQWEQSRESQQQWQRQSAQPAEDLKPEERPTVWEPPAPVKPEPEIEIAPENAEPVSEPQMVDGSVFTTESKPEMPLEDEDGFASVSEPEVGSAFELGNKTEDISADTTAKLESLESVNDFYNDMMETIQENDRVDGD